MKCCPRQPDNRGLKSVQLYLHVVPIDIDDIAFLKAVESLVAEPVVIDFSQSEEN
ncbi:MAG: hypothetical protein R2827_07445 [Bdellovibrionales bacterium]